MVLSLILSVQFVSLRRHYEIILVQTMDLMGPPLNGHFAPLGHDKRMMVFFFCGSANFIGKHHRFCKVLELKNPLKPLFTVDFFDLPFRHLWVELRDLTIRQSRLAASTCDTFKLN